MLKVMFHIENFILFRYQGKSKALMYDVTKIISALKGKRGDHRVFRLAENLCLNLIFSLRDFFLVRREGKVFALVSMPELFFIYLSYSSGFSIVLYFSCTFFIFLTSCRAQRNLRKL